MLNKLSISLIVVFMMISSLTFAEKYKYPKLKPADPPCLYLLDDEGNETSTVANPPCDQGGTIVTPGNVEGPAQKDKPDDTPSAEREASTNHNSTRSNRSQSASVTGNGCDDDCDTNVSKTQH